MRYRGFVKPIVLVVVSAGLAAGWAGGGTAAPSAAETSDRGETAILDARSLWRCHVMWKTLQVRRKSGGLQFVSVDRKRRLHEVTAPRTTDSPPPGWAAPAFDDSAWSRARTPLFARWTQAVALVCVRGRFQITDPAALTGTDLNVSVAYHGGAAVYVNGREVARGNLPEGRIGPDTPAEDYPHEAYVAPQGYRLRWVGFGDPEKYKERFALRTRALTARIPASALRKGTNVLAIEIHRAPTSETYFTAPIKDYARYSLWDLCSLESVTLTGPAGGGVIANVAPPKGLRVFNWPATAALHSIDFADACEPLRPIEIAGARNGAFSGQVGVGSDEPIKGLTAAASDLTSVGGAKIPTSAIQVRYPLSTDGVYRYAGSGRGRPASVYDQRGVRHFDALVDAAPAEVPIHEPARGAVQPVWITVTVPRDAAPGAYTGTLTVSAEGAKVADVAIRLTVADWVLPDPKRFESFVGLVQSPNTLAAKYNVPMWSEAHWKLLDRTFALLGQVGTKDVYILARGRTFHGNEQSMIRWIKRPDGTWDHDFSIVERYLDLAVKYLGTVPVVGVYCWDVDSGSTYFGYPRGHKHAHLVEKTGQPFTVLDPKTGLLSEARSPKWGEPAVRAFWKPVFGGLRKVLAERGLEQSMMIGLTPDKRPEKDAVEDLKAVSGGAPWISHAHPYSRDIHGQPVGYLTTVWGAGSIPDPATKRCYGWKTPFMAAVYPRLRTAPCGEGLRNNSAPLLYRMAVERALLSTAGLRGIGRCGADFWPVSTDRRGRPRSVLGRYAAASAWHGGWIWYAFDYVIAPGPTGPVSTVRFEMLREGVQQAEARISLEKILTDPARRAGLGADLAARCQRILDERVRDSQRAMAQGGGGLPFKWYVGGGVARRTAELYAAAAAAGG